MNLKRTTDLVKHLLQAVPYTRSNDDILYYEVCKARCKNCLQVPFGIVISNRTAYNLPSYESVSRARRKVQECSPELSAVPVVEVMREVQEEAYIAYARQVTV